VRKVWRSHGLRCKILMGPVGALNGYVAVRKNHPLFGKDYKWETCGHHGCHDHSIGHYIDVHGGLTYAGGDKGGKPWWFGFDTAHSDDDPRFGGWTKDMSYVKGECESLAKQLANWKSKPTSGESEGASTA
jgi:hypothetical protein